MIRPSALPHVRSADRRWVLLGVLVVVAQVLWPLGVRVWGGDPPQRFGWQMFSAISPSIEILADGVTVPLDEIVVDARPEIRWTDARVVVFVCERTGASELRITTRGVTEVVPC